MRLSILFIQVEINIKLKDLDILYKCIKVHTYKGNCIFGIK